MILLGISISPHEPPLFLRRPPQDGSGDITGIRVDLRRHGEGAGPAALTLGWLSGTSLRLGHSMILLLVSSSECSPPNLHTLTAWWCLGEDLARATWKRIRRVLLDHAGRLIESGRQLILRMRKAGTEELQAALQQLGARSTVPG